MGRGNIFMTSRQKRVGGGLEICHVFKEFFKKKKNIDLLFIFVDGRERREAHKIAHFLWTS